MLTKLFLQDLWWASKHYESLRGGLFLQIISSQYEFPPLPPQLFFWQLKFISHSLFMPTYVGVFLLLLLRYNSYALQCPLLNCTSQCFLVCSQGCATITVNFRTFLSPKQETPYLSAVTSHSLSPPPGNHSSSCLYIAYSGHFIQMEPYKVWVLVSCFFHFIFRIHSFCTRHQEFVPFF